MDIKMSVYFFLLFCINALGILRWKILSTGERYIAVLMFLTLIDELFAEYAAYRWHNNLPIYHIYTPIEFFLVSMYFNTSVKAFRKRNIGMIWGVAGIVLSVCNTLFIQKTTTINSYFLLFEGISIIIYCLYSFHYILLDEKHLSYRLVQFWITVCFFLYWSSTFPSWGISTILEQQEFVLNPILDKVLTGANFAFYLGIVAIFILYKKLIPTRA